MKERLLAAVPDLSAHVHVNGKDILLSYDNDIGTVINFACESSFDSDAVVLAKAAKIVRREIFDYENKFDGSFGKDCLKAGISDTLLSFIRMILDGPNIKHQTNSRSSIAAVISQFLIFNSAKFASTSSSTVRHNVDRETPVPTYLGLMLHASTRKRDLVDKFHSLGLSISYDRLLQISKNFANNVCELYEEEGVVCPPKLRKQVFTTAAVDNIDHNPSSTTASVNYKSFI